MDRLIDELTFYSKIDTNRIPYTYSKINVAQYFRDCIEEVGLDMEARGIELGYFNYVDEEVLIIADAEQMKRVINNIISNSVNIWTRRRASSTFALKMWGILSRWKSRITERALRQRICQISLTVSTARTLPAIPPRGAAESGFPSYERLLRTMEDGSGHQQGGHRDGDSFCPKKISGGYTG